MAKFTYYPQGTCSTQIDIEIADGIISKVSFVGGCNGNLQGISRLIKGKDIDDVIETLQGIRCGYKTTSCPDQLALALQSIKKKL